MKSEISRLVTLKVILAWAEATVSNEMMLAQASQGFTVIWARLQRYACMEKAVMQRLSQAEDKYPGFQSHGDTQLPPELREWDFCLPRLLLDLYLIDHQLHVLGVTSPTFLSAWFELVWRTLFPEVVSLLRRLAHRPDSSDSVWAQGLQWWAKKWSHSTKE